MKMLSGVYILPNTSLAALVAVCAVVYSIIYWLKRRHLWDMSSKIPGPKPLALIGSAHLFFGCSNFETTLKLRELRRHYGKTTKIWLGNRLYVLVTDPLAMENTMDSKNMQKRSELFGLLTKDLFGNGLLLNSGDTWRRHRKIVSHVFRYDVIESFVSTFTKNADILSDKLKNVTSPCILDIYDYAILCMLDAVCETVIGTNMDAQVKNNLPYGQYFTDFLLVVRERASKPWLRFDFIFRLTNLYTKHRNAVNFFQEVARRILYEDKERYEQKINGQDTKTNNIREKTSVLTMLIESGVLTDQEILDETITMVMTGAETTATAFSSTLVLLGEHHDVQNKILDEQMSIYGDDAYRPVSSEDLRHMPYLDQVIKEVLRLFPAVSTFSRQVVEDTDLGNGYQVPKGADILILVSDLHRDQDHFPDPDRFDPDRFAPENCAGRHPGAYIPFGWGRRSCPGMKYSIMELKTLLSVVLRRYRIVRAVDGIKEIENNLEYGITLKPSIGFKIQIEPR